MNDSPIIVALDGKSLSESLDIAEVLHGHVWGYKVNDLYAQHGLEAVKRLAYRGRVMLDAKWYDIPNTVRNYARRVLAMGTYKPDIVTVHGGGGREMILAASMLLKNTICAVTCLTSFDELDSNRIWGVSPAEVVNKLVKEATAGKASYVVCSPQELGLACFEQKNKWSFKGQLITPGIRPAWYQDKNDDQERTMTPAEAMAAGADFLVMGRPILTAENRLDAVKRTLDEIEEGKQTEVGA